MAFDCQYHKASQIALYKLNILNVSFVPEWKYQIRLAVLAPVVQTLDSAIHRIKIYLVDNAIGFPNTYPLDSDLSAG